MTWKCCERALVLRDKQLLQGPDASMLASRVEFRHGLFTLTQRLYLTLPCAVGSVTLFTQDTLGNLKLSMTTDLPRLSLSWQDVWISVELSPLDSMSNMMNLKSGLSTFFQVVNSDMLSYQPHTESWLTKRHVAKRLEERSLASSIKRNQYRKKAFKKHCFYSVNI